MPGTVPPYQYVIAIADSANAVNGWGKWKYKKACAPPRAAATETTANPYRRATDAAGRSIHSALRALAIAKSLPLDKSCHGVGPQRGHRNYISVPTHN